MNVTISLTEGTSLIVSTIVRANMSKSVSISMCTFDS